MGLDNYRMCFPAEFQKWLVLSGKKKSTVENGMILYRSLLKKGVCICKPGIALKYLVKLKESNFSSSHINSFVNLCRVYYKFSKEENSLCTEELAGIRFIKDKYKPRATLSVEEIQKFLSLEPPIEFCGHSHSKGFYHVVNPKKYRYWTVFFSIMAYTGMRTGEVAKLKVDNVDFGRNIFVLEDTKTNEDRLVPIPKNILSLVQEYVNEVKVGYLFYSKRPDGHTSNVEWNYNFHTRLKRLNIVRPNLTPYSLRHSYITEMLQTEGVNIFDVKNLVGHHDTRTTENYYHLTVKRLQRVSEKHPGVVGSNSRSILVSINEFLDRLELHRDKRFKIKKEFGEKDLSFEITIVN